MGDAKDLDEVVFPGLEAIIKAILRARDVALEEAARVAEPEPEYAYHYEAREALNKAAAAIRALKSGPRERSREPR